MLPTESSDSPPPRPTHIWSVEENIAYFRRCSPESTYYPLGIYNSASSPKRPRSRTLSVHSSDEESVVAGSGRKDTVNSPESTRYSDTSVLEWSDSISSTDSDAEDAQDREEELCVFRMSSASLQTSSLTKKAATEPAQQKTAGSPQTSPILTAKDPEPAQDDPRPFREPEEMDVDGPTQLPTREPPPAAGRDCEWCCRPALDASNVCATHKLREEEEAQRNWEITGYSKFRKEQLARKSAEKAVLETDIKEKWMRHRQMRDTDGEARLLEEQIRHLERELGKREIQIEEWEREKEREKQRLLRMLPIPSLKTIVQAYHGKIATYTCFERDVESNQPVWIEFKSKRCTC